VNSPELEALSLHDAIGHDCEPFGLEHNGSGHSDEIRCRGRVVYSIGGIHPDRAGNANGIALDHRRNYDHADHHTGMGVRPISLSLISLSFSSTTAGSTTAAIGHFEK
jgi:hypothetical protein